MQNFYLMKTKFDLIISNPPYGKIDLKILKSIYQYTDRLLFVHPDGWLYDNKMKFKLYNDCRELVKDYFIYYEKVEKPNEVFGINVHTDILITYIDKFKEGIKDKIYDIDKNGNDELYLSIKKKVLDYCKNIDNFENHKVMTKHRKNSVKNKEIVSLSEIRGHNNTNDFYTMLQKEEKHCLGLSEITGSSTNADIDQHTFIRLTSDKQKKHLDPNSEYRLKFYFDTKEEQINCFNYLKTKFARFCLSIYKINQHLDGGELGSVPYFDFTKQWTNELCAKELNITDEELTYMINKIPNYYKEDFE
jgi:hypothetical protein